MANLWNLAVLSSIIFTNCTGPNMLANEGSITCLLLLILMLWPRQAIFKSKGDNMSSSAECRIWTQGLLHKWTGLSLVQVMTYWLFDWKPLPEPMVISCQLHSSASNFEISIKMQFFPTKMELQMLFAKCQTRYFELNLVTPNQLLKE